MMLGEFCTDSFFYMTNDRQRNISEPLRGERQTNQRAELTAVARALDHIAIDRSVLIHTDSNYAIKCLTEWFHNWEKNNWRSSSGKAVENRDLVEPILARIRERDMCRAKTHFKWIKGHGSDAGNVAADMLAVQGSRNSTPGARREDIKDISPTLGGTKADYDDAAEYEALFANLADERAAATNGDGASPYDFVPSPFAVDQLSREGPQDGMEQLNGIVNDDPPPMKTDTLDGAPDKVDGS